MSKVKVIIVTDVRFYAEGLASYLNSYEDIEIISVFFGAHKVPRDIPNSNAQLIFVDANVMDAHWLAGRLRASNPKLEVIALGVMDTPQEIIRCAGAGFSGYIPAQATLSDVRRLVREAMCGELTCPPHIAKQLFLAIADSSRVAPPSIHGEMHLTDRENQILSLICRGCSNKEIARDLSIAASTVKNHVHNILSKLHVKRRNEAVRFRRVPTS